MVQREEREQIVVMEWARLQECRWPDLKLLFHIPNGGKRNAREAAYLKFAGVKSGVPDLFLPVAVGNYHGLWIELKAGKNRATENQKQWLSDLRTNGYAAQVCIGSGEAIDTIKNYLEGNYETIN